MTEIQLDSKNSIEGDPHQWVLRTKKGGTKSYCSYYSNLKQLLQDYIDLRIRTKKGITDIQALLDYQKSVVSHLNQALKPLEVSITMPPYGRGSEGGVIST